MATAAPEGAPRTAPEPAPPMSHRQILEALSGLLLGMFVAILSSTVVANALPTIIVDLQADETTYTWVITASLLATTVSTPLWGKLADLISKKLLVQLGLVVFVIGSAIAGVSQNPEMLIAARVVQGLGVGGLTALAQVIMAVMISPRERGRYSGYLGAVFALATIGGPLIGGVIVDTSWLGWRWCFYVGVPFAVVALIVLQKTLHLPSHRRDVKVDWGGAALITASVSLLLVWVSFAGRKYDWLSWQTAAMVGGAVVLALLFLLVESKAREPIIPLRLFRTSAITLAVVASMLVGLAMFGATTFLSQYFQLARAETPTMAGIMTLPMIFGLALSSTVAGQIITRTGRWKIFLIIGGLMLTAGFGLMGTLRYDTDYWLAAVYMFCIGVGVGLTMQNLVLSVQNQVAVEDLGAASSVVAFSRSLGGAIGVGALGAVLGHRVTQYIADGLAEQGIRTAPGNGSIPSLPTLPAPVRTVVQSAYGHGVGDIFLYAAPFALLALVAILFIKEIPLRTRLAPDSEPEVGPGAGAEARPYTAGRNTNTAGHGRHAHGAQQELISVRTGAATTPDGPVAAQAMLQTTPYASVGSAELEDDSSGIRGYILNGERAPVGYANLTLIDVNGRQLARETTYADGWYSLATPGSGTFVLIASAPEHEPQVATLVVGDRPLDFDLVLTGSGGLIGAVRNAYGKPVQDAMVILADARGEVVATGTTDVDGGFTLTGMGAGTYTLAVSAEAHRPTALPVEIGSGQTRQDVELLAGTRINGTVRVKGGGPLLDARVTLLDPAGNVVGTVTTGPDGEYGFADLTGGQYTVIAAGYPPVASTLTLTGQGDDAHDVWLGHPDD